MNSMVAAHAKKLYVIKESKNISFYCFLWVKTKKHQNKTDSISFCQSTLNHQVTPVVF